MLDVAVIVTRYSPGAVLAGGAVAGIMGLLVALPSFKVRGDYLAIITLAFLMIVKSALENIETLLGKYGEEGDKLLYKVLRRGEGESTGEDVEAPAGVAPS